MVLDPDCSFALCCADVVDTDCSRALVLVVLILFAALSSLVPMVVLLTAACALVPVVLILIAACFMVPMVMSLTVSFAKAHQVICMVSFPSLLLT